MKIVFFIGVRQLNNYSFDKIKNREKFIFSAIIDVIDTHNLSNEVRKHFDVVHEIHQTKKDPVLTTFDIDKLVDCIEKDMQKFKTKDIAIVCQDEANVLVAGELRGKFNVQTGARLDALKNFRDKVLMKKMLLENSIRIPYFIELNNEESDYEKLVAKLGSPFIIKLRDSAGCFGVYKIFSKVEYDGFLSENKNTLEFFEAEEFINGDLFHVDTLIKDKKILFQKAGVYSRPNLEFKNGYSVGSMVLLDESDIYKRLAEFAASALQALEMPDGCHHMELFINKKNEIVFLEVGARAPGFQVINMYEKSYGVNFVDKDLSMQADVEFDDNPIDPYYSFWAVFPIQKGEVEALVEPTIQSKYSLTWKVKVGEKTKECDSVVDYSALIFVWNKNYEILRNDFEIIKEHKAVEY